MIGWIMVLVIFTLLRVLATTKCERGFMNMMLTCFIVGSGLLWLTQL